MIASGAICEPQAFRVPPPGGLYCLAKTPTEVGTLNTSRLSLCLRRKTLCEVRFHQTRRV